MAKFYEIQIGDVYLTSNGESSGDPCKIAVAGADALLSPYSGTTFIAVDGTPINQAFAAGTKGRTLEIRVSILNVSVWTDLVTLLNTALANSATINIIGTGEIGNFDVEALPLLPRPFEAAEFKNGRIRNPIFRFITV